MKKKSDKTRAIEEKVDKILGNRKNANLILEIVALLDQDESPLVVSSAIHGVTKIFEQLFQKGDLHMRKGDSADDKTNEDTPAEKYTKWIQEIFEECLTKILSLISHQKSSINELALVTCMRWIVASHKNPSKTWDAGQQKILRRLVSMLLSEKASMKSQITRFQEYIEYPDVKQNFILIIQKIMRNKSKKEIPSNMVFLDNLVSILEITNFELPLGNENSATLLCHNEEGNTTFEFQDESVKKSFSSTWEDFLRCRMNADLYKRVLMIIDKVMPQLNRPLLLTDFLMNSYNVGGSISLLALNGVFALIQNHNLEYPEFYTKLYALFQPDVLHVKYRARFFHLADLFLTSTHLPEYLVAAFVKRLARISLMAPAHSLQMVCAFIGNLLLRHRGLKRMITGEVENFESDPFDMDEPDPSKCRAIDSCIWEIQTLQSHCLPQVSAAAKFINKKLPEMEWDVSEFLELTMEEMMEKESKKKVFVNVPLTFERPVQMKFPRNDLTSKYFCIS